MRTRLHKHQFQSNGFTIIELLIATVIFSMVLLLLTTGILEVTSVYLKGNNDATTQTTANSVLQTISQAVQYNSGTVTPTTVNGTTPGTYYQFCIGNEGFIYMLGYELVSGTPGTHETNYALVEDNLGCTVADTQAALASEAAKSRELLSPDMRLSKLVVQCAAIANGCTTDSVQAYNIEVRIAYGDGDLLFNPGDSSYTDNGPNATCKGDVAGSQFCSVTDLSTITVKRVQ